MRALGVLDELLGGHLLDRIQRNPRFRVAQRLGGEPVLAEIAFQVATQHAKGQRIAAGQEMCEWFLLDGIHRCPGDVTVRNHQLALPIEAHLADAALAGRNRAAVCAGVADDFMVVAPGE